MFNQHKKTDYNEALPGVMQKTLVFGDKTLMTEFLLAKGSSLPLHAHPYEQTGYLVKGRIRLKIGEEEFDVNVGDAWNIPMNVAHGAQVMENSTVIEVFSPAREDYLPKEQNG
jgi:quercetin dioxygenase-like cupin family protein